LASHSPTAHAESPISFSSRHLWIVGFGVTAVTVFAGLIVFLWGLGRAASDPASTATTTRWFLALWDNLAAPAPRAILYANFTLAFLVGIGQTFVYGTAFAPVFYRVSAFAERPWLCGALFAPISWTLNLLVVSPLSGAGLLGTALAGGGFPWISLAAHLLHGVLVASVLDATRPRGTAS
jgi:hypothetical protein